MPKYTINGQTIDSPTELSDANLVELSAQLGAKPVTPVTTTEQMVGLGSPIARTLKGAVANPLLALNQAGGALMGFAGEGIEAVTGPNVTTKFLKDVASGSSNVVNEYEKATKEARKRVGSEGIDLIELGGAVVSPVNRFLPSGTAGIAGRGAVTGVAGAVLNPVVGENLTPEQVTAGKVEQAGLGAFVGRVGTAFANALTPTLKVGARELMDKGIPVTPGQAYEGIPGMLYRQIEKLDLPGMRVNKDAINLGYTKAVGNDVLSSINQTVPNTVQNGQQAFAYINKALNKSYEDALDKIGTVKVDPIFDDALTVAKTAIADSLEPKQATMFNNFIKANVTSRIKDGELTGKDLKKIEEIFRTKIDSIKAVDTPAETLKAGYDDAYKAIKGFIARNDATGDVAAANLGWMKQARFMEAVNKNAAEIAGTQGTFSPAEMAKIAAKQGGEFEAAKGIAPLQAEANKALNIVGDTTQEAQKFRTLMIAGKLSGLGALGLFSPTIALPLLTASGLSYGVAKKLMQDPGATRIAVQKAIQDNPGLLGNLSGNVQNQMSAPAPAPAVPSQQTPVQQPQSKALPFSGNLQEAYPKLASTVVGGRKFDPENSIAQQVRLEADRQGLGAFSDLLVRQAFQESSFNPNARSNKNAGGVMQIIPSTAKELGLKNVYNPTDNIRAGVTYMKQLLTKYNNNPELALAAYNWGPGRVDKQGIEKMPSETRKYLRNILGKE
ncbi:LT_GEWL domain containing protein [uncultured Caudovirales phage]|uniref:LT_GEWL domain containing protein n=1 Tax=uncultured Caudovirales phage TaxID=2100421 RepID=A0A6J5MRX4_9CAUD|nr:LT_GEWL domain containing protein [uncultured Caudovirales phage]